MSKKKSTKSGAAQPKVHKIKAKVESGTRSKKVDRQATRVTKISAKSSKVKTDASSKAKVKTESVESVANKKTQAAKKTSLLAKVFKPIVLFNRYLKSSWRELKKVHWPSRKSTWAMVFAVVGYSLFFLVLVLALDNFFSYIFKLMLK